MCARISKTNRHVIIIGADGGRHASIVTGSTVGDVVHVEGLGDLSGHLFGGHKGEEEGGNLHGRDRQFRFLWEFAFCVPSTTWPSGPASSVMFLKLIDM